jgi:hypothetical protein
MIIEQNTSFNRVGPILEMKDLSNNNKADDDLHLLQGKLLQEPQCGLSLSLKEVPESKVRKSPMLLQQIDSYRESVNGGKFSPFGESS